MGRTKEILKWRKKRGYEFTKKQLKIGILNMTINF